jgi:hypothetical protein
VILSKLKKKRKKHENVQNETKMSVDYYEKRPGGRKWQARLCIGKSRKTIGYYATKDDALAAWKIGAAQQIKDQSHPWRPWASKENTRFLCDIDKQMRTPWMKWACCRENGLWVRGLIFKNKTSKRARKESELNWGDWVYVAVKEIQSVEARNKINEWQRWAKNKHSGLIQRKKYLCEINKKRNRKDVIGDSRNTEIQMCFDWTGFNA